MAEITNEERIARDKEAVAKLIGAREAMAASLRRITDLETILRHTQVRLNSLAGNVGEGLFYQVIENGSYKAVSLKGELCNWSNAITKVL